MLEGAYGPSFPYRTEKALVIGQGIPIDDRALTEWKAAVRDGAWWAGGDAMAAAPAFARIDPGKPP